MWRFDRLVALLFLVSGGAAFVLEIPSGVIGAVEMDAMGATRDPPPAFDCVVAEWSGWSESGAGAFIRHREVLQAPLNGGAACPSLLETSAVDPGATTTTTTTGEDETMTTTKTTTTTTPDFGVVSIKKRDMLFLVDMSGSLSETEFEKVMGSLALIVDKFCEEVTAGPESPLRIALVTFDHRIRLDFDFHRFNTKEQIKEALMQTHPLQPRGATCTGEALQYAADVMFQEERGSRPDATRDVLLLTDGLWNCGVDARVAAESLKQKASIYSLLIGHFTPSGFQQMNSLLSGPSDSHLFSLKNVDQLHHLIYYLNRDPLKLFQNCAPANLVLNEYSVPGSTIVIPETDPEQLKTTAGQVKTTVGQVKTTVGQVKTTEGQVKTTLGQLKTTIQPPYQEKTTRGQFKTTLGQFKTTLGQFKTTLGQYKTTFGQFKTTLGQFKTTRDWPWQQKTTLVAAGRIPGANWITTWPGQEKTTLGQYTNTPGQAKTTLGQLTNTPGQAKTTLGQLTNTPGQAKTTIGQVKTTLAQSTNGPWPWQQKTTVADGIFQQKTESVGQFHLPRSLADVTTVSGEK